MKVRALKSFFGRKPNGGTWRVSEGQEFELPPGTDWLKAGLVEPIKRERRKTATKKAPEKAVSE